ncbi:hypothetical protein O5290_31160, partial [Escherichia coli]|nr:hypothetical protein [Escherichia coli]
MAAAADFRIRITTRQAVVEQPAHFANDYYRSWRNTISAIYRRVLPENSGVRKAFQDMEAALRENRMTL